MRAIEITELRLQSPSQQPRSITCITGCALLSILLVRPKSHTSTDLANVVASLLDGLFVKRT
jgi:hypothetical protein